MSWFIIAAVVIAIFVFMSSNKSNRVSCADKRSYSDKYIGRPYYDSIPTGGKELEDFMAIGGTLIMPATNTTHLYYEIKKAFPDLEDVAAKYLALQINSSAAREELPESTLKSFVQKYQSLDWKDLCRAYTWEWNERVGGIPNYTIPDDLKMDAEKKIIVAIERAAEDIKHGMVRYAPVLMAASRERIYEAYK